jgi:hypothetical protein
MTRIASPFRIAAMAVALWACLASAAGNNPLGLPSDLAAYRQWAQPLKSPYPVPLELWTLCRTPTAARWAAAREKQGPHVGRFIRVYGNAAAVAAFSSLENRPFPPGAVIAKEKLSGSPDGVLEGVGFMVKRKDSEFSKSAGWEFLYFPHSGDNRRTQEACATCHRAAPNDFIFGHYPR